MTPAKAGGCSTWAGGSGSSPSIPPRRIRSTPAPPGCGAKIYVDPRSPRRDRTLYVAGHSTVWRREGGQWKAGEPPAGGSRLLEVSLGFPAGDGAPTAYAIARDAIYVSGDGGMTWKASP